MTEDAVTAEAALPLAVAAAAPRPTREDRVRAALWFAERGFGVFTVWSTTERGTCRCPKATACTSPGKHPIVEHGFQDGTRDATRIRTLLSAGSDPNYGLVCPEGVFALDVDGDDVARLATLEAELGALPPTLRTLTANGQHIFLRWPEAEPRPLHKMFGFVTRWGSGRQAGYVIGPRSIHPSGFAYAPDGPFEIAEMPPAWVRAALAEAKPAVSVTVGGPATLPEPGHRHDWLRDRARHFRGFIDDPGVLRAAVLAENARLLQPKTDEEVDRAIGDVFTRFPLDPPDVAADRIDAKLGDDTLDFLPTTPGAPFPDSPAGEAFGGLLGECVFDLAEGTDASLVGLLGSCLAFAGALVPGLAYFHRIQTSSPFIALVGESSIGRKGTAMMRGADAFADALGREHVNRAILDGLSSGEGLVTTMHWKQSTFPNEPAVGLVFEEEYATLLAARSREGSTLDPKMRQAFDGGAISNRRSGDTKTVSPPYWLPALIAITPDELRSRLEVGAMASGSANRWLHLPVIRRDIVPTNADPRFGDSRRAALVAARRTALGASAPLGVEPVVVKVLAEYADFLPTVAHGLARDLTRRLGVIAFRVALVHALLERSQTVTSEHLARALALTEYARQGIPWVFGHTIGNRDADLLLRHLLAGGRLTHRVITRSLIRDPIRRQAAIDELVRLGTAHVETIYPPGGGRARMELVSSTRRGAAAGFNSTHLPGRLSKNRAIVHYSDSASLGSAVSAGQLDKTPDLSTNQPANRWPIAGQSMDKTPDIGTELQPPESDATGPPTVVSTPTETGHCHFYDDHRAEHRYVDGRWVCPICAKEEPS